MLSPLSFNQILNFFLRLHCCSGMVCTIAPQPKNRRRDCCSHSSAANTWERGVTMWFCCFPIFSPLNDIFTSLKFLIHVLHPQHVGFHSPDHRQERAHCCPPLAAKRTKTGCTLFVLYNIFQKKPILWMKTLCHKRYSHYFSPCIIIITCSKNS